MDNRLVVDSREELMFLLCEASELEHMLMCEYLFAAFSLKQRLDEDLTPEQLDAVRRWERVVTGVAVQEMLHLAQASNLMTAIGGLPHLRHPNFPQRAKYYPPSVQLALMPFGEHALQHFVYLERPEGLETTDAPEFDIIGTDFDSPTGTEIVPVPQSFTTVGQLYRSIEQGLRTLVARYGERGVFIGPPKAQASGDVFRWPELVVVTDLASAERAIEMVVEQGEGARGSWEDAHYGRFLRTLRELRELKQRDPAFDPARPVLPAYVRAPSDVERFDLLSDQRTAAVCDLFNGSYEALLEMLLRFFLHVRDSDDELRELADTGVGMMFSLIAPLGHLLTTLPVGPSAPGRTAGPNFEIYRRSYLLPHHDAAWAIIREKLAELAGACQRTAELFTAPEVGAAHATLATTEQQLRALVESLTKQVIRV
ncbi:MAG TPA: ferritin-like protein [Ktedonobacterales bacterium]|nr:ferritin-like protein [Ktedonobacterales bacterium]